MRDNFVVDSKKESRDLSWFLSAFLNLQQESKSDKFYRARGHPMAVYANDYIGIQINSFGIYENELLNHLFDYINKVDDTFESRIAIDIGANIGNHSLYFANRFRKVISFEPNPNTFELLKFNIKSKSNIEAICVGLGDEVGSFQLTLTPTNLGSCFIGESENPNLEQIPVSIETLDNVLSETDDIGFLKIDAEGFEEQIIVGGQKLISKHEPIIIFEQLQGEINNGSSRVVNRLRDLGYKILWREATLSSENYLLKRLINVHNFLFGKKFSIISGDRLPKMDHSMLLAIPKSMCHRI